MKKLFTITSLFVLSISTCFSQSDARLIELLTNQLGVFSATGDAETETDSQGILSGKRLYESGDKSLELVIAIVDTEEKIDLMNGYVKDLIDMGERFDLEMQIVENENQFGVITHNQKSKSKLGGVFMRTEEYLIKAEISNTEGLQISRDLLKSLGFAVDGSSASAPAKAEATPKAEEKPATEAEKKMIRMLTDSYGSFKATGAARTGMNDDGAINVSRSYVSGNSTLDLFIEGIAVKEDAQFYKKMANEKITYYQGLSGADVKVIAKEKLQGALFYNSNDNTGAIQLVVRDQHYMLGTIDGASGMEDVKAVFQSFDYSLLK